jgi:hypothetical protein
MEGPGVGQPRKPGNQDGLASLFATSEAGNWSEVVPEKIPGTLDHNRHELRVTTERSEPT